jgi:hypothetical protein
LLRPVFGHPTGVNHSLIPFSSASALNTTDQIVLQTLEDHILPLIPAAPSYIHNIHLKLNIPPQCYLELDLPITHRNKGKKYAKVIGNGTVNIEVRCSNNPFRLQTEEDRSSLLVFFGQIKQELISILSDSRERIVPNVM